MKESIYICLCLLISEMHGCEVKGTLEKIHSSQLFSPPYVSRTYSLKITYSYNNYMYTQVSRVHVLFSIPNIFIRLSQQSMHENYGEFYIYVTVPLHVANWDSIRIVPYVYVFTLLCVPQSKLPVLVKS